MKKTFTFLTMLFVLTTISAQEQINQLQDTLIKETYISPMSGQLVIKYKDITDSYDDLPKPKDENGKIPEVFGFDFNTIEKIYQIAHDIFTREEIKKMDDSEGFIKFIALSSEEIVSVSFLFWEKDPEIFLSKLVKFSKKLKENITITTAFSNKIFEEGYVEVSLSWMDLGRAGAK